MSASFLPGSRGPALQETACLLPEHDPGPALSLPALWGRDVLSHRPGSMTLSVEMHSRGFLFQGQGPGHQKFLHKKSLLYLYMATTFPLLKSYQKASHSIYRQPPSAATQMSVLEKDVEGGTAPACRLPDEGRNCSAVRVPLGWRLRVSRGHCSWLAIWRP